MTRTSMFRPLVRAYTQGGMQNSRSRAAILHVQARFKSPSSTSTWCLMYWIDHFCAHGTCRPLRNDNCLRGLHHQSATFEAYIEQRSPSQTSYQPFSRFEATSSFSFAVAASELSCATRNFDLATSRPQGDLHLLSRSGEYLHCTPDCIFVKNRRLFAL